MKCEIIDLGLTDYQKSLDIQKSIFEKITNSASQEALIFVQHPPVITLGRNGKESNILLSMQELKNRGIEVFRTDRGGDTTYHGPGQIVAWPLFDLKKRGKDIHKYLRLLEDTVILVLKDNGVIGKRTEGLTGVWVGDGKLSSIGIGIRKWMTYHGISLNVNTSMEHLGFINPCGLKGSRSTTMADILGMSLEIEAIKRSWKEKFKIVFDLELEEIEKFP